MSLATHRPVVHALERWTKEHLTNRGSAEYRRYLSRFRELLAQKHEEQLAEHDNEGTYGMSGAGGCLLKADLKKDGVKGIPPEGYTLETWDLGHELEVRLIARLEAIGCVIDGFQAKVRTYRTDGSPLHVSMTDGVIVSTPPELKIPTPCILSCKSTAYKSATYVKGGGGAQKRRGFSALPFGVRNEEPSWFLQAQLEMHGTHENLTSGRSPSIQPIEHVLIVVVAKDVVQAFAQDDIMKDSGSLSFYAELIPYEEKLAKLLCFGRETYDHRAGLPQLAGDSIKLVNLPAPGSAGGPGSKGWSMWGGPNQQATGTFNPCGGCEYQAHCAKTYGGGQ